MKEFLSQRGIPYREYDVGADREAAFRMIRLSGQQGVPVTTLDDEVVVGFDRRRLEEILSRRDSAKLRLGASVADAEPRVQIEGAYVGRVLPHSPVANAGLQVGDVIIELNHQPVHTAADLERVAVELRAGQRWTLVYARHGRILQAEVGP